MPVSRKKRTVSAEEMQAGIERIAEAKLTDNSTETARAESVVIAEAAEPEPKPKKKAKKRGKSHPDNKGYSKMMFYPQVNVRKKLEREAFNSEGLDMSDIINQVLCERYGLEWKDPK